MNLIIPTEKRGITDTMKTSLRLEEAKKPEIVVETTLPLNGDEPLFEETKPVTETTAGEIIIEPPVKEIFN